MRKDKKMRSSRTVAFVVVLGISAALVCLSAADAPAQSYQFRLNAGPTGSVAEVKPPVVKEEGLKVVEISEPGKLTQSNTKYVLTKDISAAETAFSFGRGVKNVILDLGGHVVTYNTEKKKGIPGKPYSECVYGVSIAARGMENIVVRNGTILQGKGSNAGSHAVRIGGGKSIEVTGVNCRVHGPSTSCVSSLWGGPAGRIHDNYLENHGTGLKRGLHTPDGIVLSQSGPGWEIYNNTIIGGHRGIAVWNNATGGNYDSKANIHHNRISPRRVHGQKAPQGILCFGSAMNHIHENEISTDDARGINLQGRGSGGSHVHNNLIACRYSTVAKEGNYVENRCYGYWERDGRGNRLHDNLFIVGNEVPGDRTSNSIGILATTTGANVRLTAAEFKNNRIIVSHSNPNVPVLGFEIKRSDKDVIVKGNEILARTAAIRVWQKSDGVQLRDNVLLKMPDTPKDAGALDGDSIEKCTRQGNREAVVKLSRKSPARPTGLRAIHRFEAIELRWKRSAEKDVVGYNVYCDGKRISAYPVGGRFYVHLGVKPGEAHTYEVAAVDLANRESRKSRPLAVRQEGG